MRRIRLIAITGALVASLGGCHRPVPGHSYLYVFAGADSVHGGGSDFLAVIDADSTSPRYAQVVATAPIHAIGTMPHHTELVMPPHGEWLFADGYMSGRTFLFDLTHPLAPRMAATIDSVPGYAKPHTYWRLADGQVVATLQYGDGRLPGNPGGLALFSAKGDLLHTASAADSNFPGAAIRTYSMDVDPAIDRVITTSSPMVDELTTDVLQIWRLSDLTLLRTLQMPVIAGDSTSRYPFEVRFLPGDSLAFLNTWNCGLFLVSGVRTTPVIEHLLSMEQPRNNGCGVPLLFGHYWIMPVGSAHVYRIYDIADAHRPRAVDSLITDSSWVPHWIAREPGSNRLVLTSNPHDERVMLARFDSTSGHLSWDSTFADPVSHRLGVDFNRRSWPHGDFGSAQPHAAIFGRDSASP